MSSGLFGARSCPVLPGVPDPLPEGFRRDFAGATRTPCSGSFSPLGEGVCLLRDRDSGKADDLVISALWQSRRGTARCASDAKRGHRSTGGTLAPTPDAFCMDVPVKMLKGSRLFFVKSRLTTQCRTTSTGGMTRCLHKPLQRQQQGGALSRPACA